MKNIIKALAITGILLWQTQAIAQTDISVKKLLPQYIEWAMKKDKEGSNIGTPLTKNELLLAKEIGIQYPEKVRIVYVDAVPYPYENAALKAMGESIGFIGEGIISRAQAFGYSIYVRRDYKIDRPGLAHELVHVLQIERTDFASMVMQYASDRAKYSYADSPLEAEAFKANIKYAVDEPKHSVN